MNERIVAGLSGRTGIRRTLGPRGIYRNMESHEGFHVLRELSARYRTISGDKLID